MFNVNFPQVYTILIFLKFVHSSKMSLRHQLDTGLVSDPAYCIDTFFCIRGCIMHRYCPALSKAFVAFANISDEQENMNWCFRLFFVLLVTFEIYCSHLIFLNFRIKSLAFENLFFSRLLKTYIEGSCAKRFWSPFLWFVHSFRWLLNKKMLIEFTLNEICTHIPWCDFVVLVVLRG